MNKFTCPIICFQIILIGKIPCKIVNLLCKSPITLLTWICTAAISQFSSTDFCSSWDFPQVNSGIFNWGQYKSTDSWTVKPWSASTRSPGSKFFNRPQFSVMYTSETRPPQGWEIYDIVPCRVIPTKTFTVLWLLQKF